MNIIRISYIEYCVPNGPAALPVSLDFSCFLQLFRTFYFSLLKPATSISAWTNAKTNRSKFTRYHIRHTANFLIHQKTIMWKSNWGWDLESENTLIKCQMQLTRFFPWWYMMIRMPACVKSNYTHIKFVWRRWICCICI